MNNATQVLSVEEGRALVTKDKRRNTGTLAQAGGQDFERSLEVAHAWYNAQDIAQIIRLPVPTSPAPQHFRTAASPRGRMRLLTERQLADYTGWTENGRAIVMEAKASSKKSASLAVTRAGDKRHDGIQLHQLAACARASRLGCLAAVVWRNGPETRLVLCGESLRRASLDAAAGGLRRIPLSSFIPYELRYIAATMAIEDWLTAVTEYLADMPSMREIQRRAAAHGH